MHSIIKIKTDKFDQNGPQMYYGLFQAQKLLLQNFLNKLIAGLRQFPLVFPHST